MRRRSASSVGVASSNRYRLMHRPPIAQTRPQAQPLTPADVEMGVEVQPEIDAQHQQAAGVGPPVPQPLPHRTPTVELPASVEAERLQLVGIDLPGPKTHVADPALGIEPPLRLQQPALA